MKKLEQIWNKVEMEHHLNKDLDDMRTIRPQDTFVKLTEILNTINAPFRGRLIRALVVFYGVDLTTRGG